MGLLNSGVLFEIARQSANAAAPGNPNHSTLKEIVFSP
jgi:hypothetical protein